LVSVDADGSDAAHAEHPNLVMDCRSMGWRSSGGEGCGYRQGSVGRLVGRRHRGGQRARRPVAFRRRENRQLQAAWGARRPRARRASAARAHGQPTLYVVTREGLRWAGLPYVDPARLNSATVRHWAVCPRLAVVLERAEGCVVWGEPRVRAAQLDTGGAVANAERVRLPDERGAVAPTGSRAVSPDPALSVAVELSVKGARRSQSIVRAWARCWLLSAGL
jgi:hypothetical protein